MATLAHSIFTYKLMNNYRMSEKQLGESKAKMLPCDCVDADAKAELLEAAQHELMKHHWDTFCTEPLSIAEGGRA
jgi:hypothetical protein